MFTAQNAQMFFHQIGYKGTTKNAHTQESEQLFVKKIDLPNG